MDTTLADPLRGSLLGERYRILGRLARGGMATVYHARDELLERDVAIKIIHPNFARDPRFLRRFVDEAKTVARLTHPNVVAVYDQGSHADAPYLVLEYVKGRTLRDILVERQRLDPAESLAMLEQILAALAAAHRSGLVHRDVKPENVLVTPPPNGSGDLLDAVVKVADFGLARAVEGPERGGELFGTAEYIAPELVTDGTADPRADVYAAGIVLFEMLTGRVPFEGDRPADVAWQHVRREVPAPSRMVSGLPPLLDQIVARATHRDPAARPADAAVMLAEVRMARDGVTALAGPTRALAHPTVAVPVAARPSWAQLPAQRGPVITVGRRRVASLGLAGSVRSARDSALGFLDGLRATRRGRRQLAAALVAIVLVLTAGGWWLGIGRYTHAPSLVSLAKATAVAEAQRMGFDVAYAAGRYSEQIPVDTVIEQRPAAGGRIVKGGTITLVLSLGPERYQVPEVAGQSADFATAQLKEHFVVEPVNGFSDSLPVNYVVGTEPPAGTPLPPNATIKLIIAKGPFPVHVPPLIGKQLAEAQQILQGMGFTVDVQRRDDESRPRDQVIDQNPAEGQGLVKAEGTTVVLVVANGPPGPPMPAVVGMRCHEAINQLRGMGLQVNANGNVFEQFFWSVQSQQPEPNTPVQPGQSVELRCG